jgi:hypothetical protein
MKRRIDKPEIVHIRSFHESILLGELVRSKRNLTYFKSLTGKLYLIRNYKKIKKHITTAVPVIARIIRNGVFKSQMINDKCESCFSVMVLTINEKKVAGKLDADQFYSIMDSQDHEPCEMYAL